MAHRPTKLDRMTAEEKEAAAKAFWEAPDEALVTPETIAIVFDVSVYWLQYKRSNGGGIPFSKPNGSRKVFYTKADAIKFFENS
ncbi:DNA-binding protein [Acinetobacter sp. YH16053]|uniref:DNA-binding protein n=1 Tax=Acinetobacter sp. YH16053 TaxID=2601192 RepID=UPI0015D0F6AE|nr:DNA-binding protein [Acinetobacter sp. YH16053]